MQDLICYKQMPLWTSETLPAMFREKHNTQSGTWAKLVVIKGSMTFSMLEENGDLIETYTFTPDNQPPFIEPQAWHKIASCSPDLQCQLAFYCRPEDYTNKKYDMTKTHSEVVNAVSYLSPCKALDLGCGSGRNSLYLNKLGFDVTAYDKNSQGIANINEIIRSDNLQGITAREFNINQQAIEGQYGFILSTVVLMFLEAGRIPSLIENMQQCTEIGGYNLIVSAMSTDDFPCTVPFSFTFKHDELKNYYAGWEIVKYNQEVGELHKTDENGNRIKLRFATILAKKVA